MSGAAPHLILIAHALATAMMFGVIWTVQVVHYPLFLRVPAAGFPAFEREHMRRIGWIVGPAMILELATATAIVVWRADLGVGAVAAWVGAALVLINWMSTVLVQGPQHRRLAGGKDDALIRRLIATNWVRTAAWSARVVIAIMIVTGARAA